MATSTPLAPARKHGTRKAQRQDAARLLVQVAPRVIQTMRARVRRKDFGRITVPQMRALRFIRRTPNASLRELAEYLIISSPSASALVNRLVSQGLVLAQVPAENRRRMQLSLTVKGDDAVAKAIQLTQDHITEKLHQLGPGQLDTVTEALELLLRCFD